MEIYGKNFLIKCNEKDKDKDKDITIDEGPFVVDNSLSEGKVLAIGEDAHGLGPTVGRTLIFRKDMHQIGQLEDGNLIVPWDNILGEI